MIYGYVFILYIDTLLHCKHEAPTLLGPFWAVLEVSLGPGPMSQSDLPQQMEQDGRKHCVLIRINLEKALCAELNKWNKKHCVLIWGMGKNKWVLEQISTLQFVVTDAWKLSSQPLGLVGQPLLVQLVLQG
jgi:hypothetical protein